MTTTHPKEKHVSEATEVQEAPQPQPALQDEVVHKLTITVYKSGRATMTGPMDRNAIIMLLVTGFDLSYDAEKQQQAALAEEQRKASAPPPRRFSKAWWAAKFAEKRAAQGGQLDSADETSARLMAAKTEGLEPANDDPNVIKINGHDDSAQNKGPAGGMPKGDATKH